MSRKLSQFEMENTITRKTSLVEEFLDIDEALIALEKNSDLIRMEMNIIEFPLFSRSRKIKIDQVKKYYFASDKSSFLEVVPGLNKTIPGEFEERVFIALLKIFKIKGYSQTFYCTASEILDNLNIDNYNTRASFYSRIREAVSKLASTSYKFKNLFYSNELGGTIDDILETSILSYHRVTAKESTKEEKYFFEDKRIKEVYKISLASYFYENIVRKGYLAFDSDELLNIKDSVTRSIYTMITKWRNDELYLKRPAFYIARRIPLSWKPETVRKTIPRIEESLIELKNSGYITDYNLLKNGKLDKAEFEIFFSSEHNKIKREIFYDERSDFNKMIHYEEERQNNSDILISSLEINNEKESNDVLIIFGEKGAKLKTLTSVISEALKNYDYSYVKYTAEYTVLNCKVSLIKYFKEALLNNWAEEYIAKKEIKAEKKAFKLENIPVIEEAVIVESAEEIDNSANWDEFIVLPQVVQEEITAAAYEDYLLETGATDSKLIRGIFEKGKKSYILKTMEKYSSQEPEISEKPIEKIEVQEPIEKPIEEAKKPTKEPKISTKKQKDNSNEMIGEYISVTKFLFEVSDLALKREITFSIEKVAPIFKVFMEFEDEFIRISYDEATKQGKINIK